MTLESTAVLDLPCLERELQVLVAEHLLDGADGIEPLSSLSAAGVDSMATMQLLLLIEDRFGLWLPEEDLTHENFACIRSLAGALARRLEARDEVV